jgi:Protein of unknown function (DUF3054)
MRRLLLPGRTARTLAVTDAAALVVFVAIGWSSHHDGLAAGGLARDLACFLGGWFAAAQLLGAYRERRLRPLLLTCALGVPLAVAARALLLGRLTHADQLAFLAVALVFTALCVAGARFALSCTTLGRRSATA